MNNMDGPVMFVITEFDCISRPITLNRHVGLSYKKCIFSIADKESVYNEDQLYSE